MNQQEFDTASTATGPLLALMSASHENELEDEGADDRNNGEITAGRLVSDSRPTVAEARPTWPKAVVPGTLPALLLIILRRPRSHCPPRDEWNLPAGCVLAVRYRSR